MQLPELLAPAGNPACALAAFDAGADAVYCGLKQFNARERTENFTADEMNRVIEYAHKHGKKVFVTLNTLIKENELDELGSALADLDSIQPDAVIVQDLGVVHAIREYFPSLTIHASTQMGLHNSAGMEFAKRLGIRRVILERQTTLTELEKMMLHKPEGIEAEMFIHGALCCCISGSCLLSSWMGGWSGNRGKCKQPCRRRYHTKDGNGFFLSSQDLCTIELMPRILKSGVASLKIEGRLRRPDYVNWTVQAYRLALEAAGTSEDAFREALPKAKEMLTHTCGRKWSLGFYTPESAETLMKHDAMGASGLLCGKVLSSSRNGFTVAAMRRIHLGDVIRVQPRTGDEGPAISVTRMTVDGSPVHTVRKDETCFIHSDKEIPLDSYVYKTGESVADYSKRLAVLPLRKPGLPLKITLDRTRIRIAGAGLTWEKSLELQEAGKHPLTPERLEEEFRNTVFDNFSISAVRSEISGNPFLPASVLKGIRMEFRNWFSARFQADSLKLETEKRLAAYQKAIRTGTGRQHRRLPDSVILPRGKKNPFPETTVIREMEDQPSPHEELLLPFFIPETGIAAVRNAIGKFAAKGGKTVRITSLDQLTLLQEFPELKIRTCMPLPVCNSLAVRELKNLGVHDVQLWIELGKTELEQLTDYAVLPVEIYRYGRPVLLSTRAAIPAEGWMNDARGNGFHLQKKGFLTQVTAEKVFSIPGIRGAECGLCDLRDARPGEEKAARFNFEFGLQ